MIEQNGVEERDGGLWIVKSIRFIKSVTFNNNHRAVPTQTEQHVATGGRMDRHAAPAHHGFFKLDSVTLDRASQVLATRVRLCRKTDVGDTWSLAINHPPPQCPSITKMRVAK